MLRKTSKGKVRKDMLDLGMFYLLKQCQSTQETQNMSEGREEGESGELEISEPVETKILDTRERSPQDLVLGNNHYRLEWHLGTSGSWHIQATPRSLAGLLTTCYIGT